MKRTKAECLTLDWSSGEPPDQSTELTPRPDQEKEVVVAVFTAHRP